MSLLLILQLSWLPVNVVVAVGYFVVAIVAVNLVNLVVVIIVVVVDVIVAAVDNLAVAVVVVF